MKYWNKDKEIRKRCWTKVNHPLQKARWIPNTDFAILSERVPSDELKRWCQQQASPGKFYHYYGADSYGADSWWFENPHDATHFLLRWS